MKNVIVVVVVAASLNGIITAAPTIIHQENFNDGSSISYSGSASFWGLSGAGPATHNFSDVDGQFFLGKAVNTATLSVPALPLDVSTFQDIQLEIALAGSGGNSRDYEFESNDYLKIFWGTYLLEEFRISKNVSKGNLMGTIDTTLEISRTFDNFMFDIGDLLEDPTAAQLSLQVFTTVEHIGIDSITITGSAGHAPAPGALLLGSIGVGLVGYLRRRQTL